MKKLPKSIMLLILLIVLLVSTLSVNAHLENGEDVKKGNLLIDFGFSPVAPLTDEEITVEFGLFNLTNTSLKTTDSAVIKVDNEIFNLNVEKNKATHTFMLTEEKAYELEITFLFEDKVVETHSFTLPVAKAKKRSHIPLFMVGLGLMILGSYILLKKRK